MADHGLALLLAILAWWFSTGLILLLCALPRRTFGWSMIGGLAGRWRRGLWLCAQRLGHRTRRALYRLSQRTGNLGLDRDEFPDGLCHRPAHQRHARKTHKAGAASGWPYRRCFITN